MRKWMMGGAAVAYAPEDDGFEYDDDLPLEGGLDDVDDADDDLPPEGDEEQVLAVDPDEPPAKPLGRRERAVLAAKRDAREARAEVARLREEVQRNAGGQSAAVQAENERREREAYALMSPDERSEFDRKKLEQRQAITEQQGRWMFADLADQRKFDRLCARDPRADRLADAVETKLAEERQRGNNFTREQLFKMLYADRLLAKAPKAVKRAKAVAAENVARNRVAAPGGRSGAPDGRAAKLSEREARRKRLENAVF